MKCHNCSEPISPRMMGAIRSNMCPFCGSSIERDPQKASAIQEACLRIESVFSPDEIVKLPDILSFMYGSGSDGKMGFLVENKDILCYIFTGDKIRQDAEKAPRGDVTNEIRVSAEVAPPPPRRPISPAKPITRSDGADPVGVSRKKPSLQVDKMAMLSEQEIMDLPEEFRDEARAAKTDADMRSLMLKIARF